MWKLFRFAIVVFCVFSLSVAVAKDSTEVLRERALHNLTRGKYLKAQDQLHQLLSIHKAEGNLKELVEDYRLLGELNRASVNFDDAIDYLRKALELNEKINDQAKKASILNRFAAVYFETKDNAKSKQYATQSNNIALKIGDTATIVNNYTIIGAIERHSNFDSSAYYFHKALRMLKGRDSLKEMLPYVLNNMALLFEQRGMYDSLIHYATKGFELANELKISAYIPMSGSMLAGAHSRVGNFEKAYKYLETSINYRDTLYEEGLVRKIAQIEGRHELERRKQENMLLNARLQYRSTLILASLLTLCLLLLITFLLLQSNRRKKRMLGNLEQKNQEIENQRRELENLNSVKNRLFSIISHDLRRPFNSLKGVFNLLQQNLISKDEWTMLSVKLGNQLNASSDLLDNLLLWAQSQSGGFNPLKIELDIKEIADENFSLLQPQAEAKTIKLVNNIQMNSMALADPDMVKLVMRNLISNAIKFSSNGDSIVLASKKRDKDIIVSVADTGTGMDAALKEKIFTAPYTTAGTSSEKGTGIGLMLCKEFIEENDGEIWVESEKGKGSTFYFSLPGV